MKILLLVSAFNGLSQRVYSELIHRGHWVSVEFANTDGQMEESIKLCEPDLIICPFLKQAIPRSIWQHYLCWIVHPGIKGDRGPSALDWAIHNNEKVWGVTLIEAAEEYDAGDIWGSKTFSMVDESKSSIYRHQITDIALELILSALKKFEDKSFKPEPLDYSHADVLGAWQPFMDQPQRQLNWQKDDTSTILRKIKAADSTPGLKDNINGVDYYIYGGHRETALSVKNSRPGDIIAQKNQAICRATSDGAIWITHLKRVSVYEPQIKLPATDYLADQLQQIPELLDEPLPLRQPATWQEIYYDENGQVGYLYFSFYNGAMNTSQCYRLLKAYRKALERPTRVIVLMGGVDFWSNGIHLNTIEASPDPGLEAWENLKQINNLVEAILTTETKVTVSALKANAAAGGVMLALACDRVLMREGVVLSPYYQHMGLYGSEFWSFSLPRRVGDRQAQQLMSSCLPLIAPEALKIGLVDEVLPAHSKEYLVGLNKVCEWYSKNKVSERLLQRKQRIHQLSQQLKPLAQYREQEEEKMWQCFMSPHSAFHQARKQFVYKLPVLETPEYLATHRHSIKHTDDQQLAG